VSAIVPSDVSEPLVPCTSIDASPTGVLGASATVTVPLVAPAGIVSVGGVTVTPAGSDGKLTSTSSVKLPLRTTLTLAGADSPWAIDSAAGTAMMEKPAPASLASCVGAASFVAVASLLDEPASPDAPESGVETDRLTRVMASNSRPLA
jgi:hypothetical protein